MHNYGPEGEGKRQRLVLQPPRPSATCTDEGCAGDVAEAAAVIGECDVCAVSRARDIEDVVDAVGMWPRRLSVSVSVETLMMMMSCVCCRVKFTTLVLRVRPWTCGRTNPGCSLHVKDKEE